MAKHKGPTKPKPTPRTIAGIPGTVEPGYRERPILPEPSDPALVERMQQITNIAAIELRPYAMGTCKILVAREPAGVGGKPLWHLSISTPSRHPTWDEIKVARYRLLPHDITMAMLLPPPDRYVNIPMQDHVMQLWEIADPRDGGQS